MSRVTRHPQRGVALIITLILLSVVTFMAITFLALSRRERGAVATVTATAGARYAADAALANAEAQIIANVLSTTNPYNFGLLVSTNYINTNGFVDGNVSPTNVNYFHSDGTPVTGNNFLQLLANLYYSPRVPVFVPINSSGANDFRFYLDLNRNGQFDTNGQVVNVDNKNNIIGPNVLEVGDPEWIGVLERPDTPYGPDNKFVARYAFIALPVGNTLDLNAIHNQAHVPSSPPAVPASWVANPPNNNPSVPGDPDRYIRNEGVGSWEINLAAFLTDLNTNEWDGVNAYQYPSPSAFTCPAFDDARALLAYRYNNDLTTLASVKYLYGVANATTFGSDHIDGYTYGQPLIGTAGFQLPTDNDSLLNSVPNGFPGGSPWAGADNTNHFFTHQELFNTSETAMGVPDAQMALNHYFTYRLLQAGTNTFGGSTIPTYDRYTFYRLLSQLGTDSTPESGKMNLNYDNLDPYPTVTNGVPVTNAPASTNFMAWTPLTFFTNAADRLLRTYTTEWRTSNPTNFATEFYAVTNFTSITSVSQWTNYPAFGIGNIPVLVSNQFVYSPAVNRLLQLAANMYDATTNSFYPSVFRPTFWITNESGFINIYINGYQQVISVSGASDLQLSLLLPPSDIMSLASSGKLGATAVNYPFGVNVCGVPWIIGAKKGFPNFNKFSMQNVVQITRKLQIRRSKIPVTTVSDFVFTNQLYAFNISNSIGIDCWNSYTNSYTNQVQIVVNDYLSMMLTNDWSPGSPYTFPPNPSPYLITTNIPVNLWPGSAPWVVLKRNGPPTPNRFSFVIPITNVVQVMSNSDYYFGGNPPGVTAGFYPEWRNLGWETNKHDFPFPNFGLLTTNRLQVFMLDGASAPYHVIDYVQFAGPGSSRNLNAEIATNLQSSGYASIWSTPSNSDNVPYGVASQIYVSRGGDITNSSLYWPNTDTMKAEVDGFFVFMGGSSTAMPFSSFNALTSAQKAIYQSYATNYIVQVPYTPTATMYEYTSWQANDPLVHYLASDLNFYGTEAGVSGPQTGIHLLTTSQSLPVPAYFATNATSYLNDRYQPWGWNLAVTLPSGAQSDANPRNLAYKDPLASYSDNWDFPTNKFPTVGWLGRVHRGTPWQTVYLKATNILNEIQVTASATNYLGYYAWEIWTGNFNPTNATDVASATNAAWTAPAQDRLLFDLFTTAFDDNATRGTLSVNVGPTNANLAAWSALFSGIVVPTNLVGGFTIINPAGPAGAPVPVGPPTSANSPLCLGYLVQNGTNGINDIRANTNLFPLQSFTHVGDILAVPALTQQSPFLAGLDPNTQISDELMEWLPQQTMGLLRCSDSPRYVIYCYGQALKPAPNGINESSFTLANGQSAFGMVTNYQVVSEIATRAVVRFGSSLTNVITGTNYVVAGITNWNWFSVPVVTNNNAVIESFNILPPD
ncbi:MAG: hypothetical protein ABSF60_02840 [Verrucomicrobiota bacterium]